MRCVELFAGARGEALGADATWRAIRKRRLTIQEAATLQGFPDDYPWQGTKNSMYRQVGNAVPPPVAQALGTAIMEANNG